MIGMGVLYLPIKSFEFFHNDARKREFVSAGIACGMSAAFGAPIGATLFGFELSQPNTFWEIQSTWKTFIACSISVIIYSLGNDIYRHGDVSEWVLDSSTLRFDAITYPNPSVEAVPTALIIGAVCGVIGATWICLNTYVHMFRKDYLSHPIMRVVEVSVLAFMTASFAFWLPFVINQECFK